MTGLDDLAIFVGIVEAGSLAGAARGAGLPKSSVSRRLVALETRLKTRLIQRSTRQLSLTDDGRRFFERCRPLVAEARAAEAEMLALPAEPHGLLRITATGAFGRLYVAPLLGEYLPRNPLVTAELLLLDRPVNLIEEGFDIAVRMGALDSSGLMSRKLGDIARVLCAAPVYLERVGPITGLADLKRLEALVSIGGNDWSFHHEGRIVTPALGVRVASNQMEVLHAAALHMCGIAVLPRYMVGDDLAAGRLVPLLPDTPPTDGQVSVLWPSSRNT